MPISRRPRCFETNSSSSHSISIANSPGQYTPGAIEVHQHYVDDHGVPRRNCVVLTGGEFGWEEATYADTITKANYLAVALCERPADDPKRRLFESVLKNATGASEIIFACSSEYNDRNWSYIDHQSSGVPFEALNSRDELKRFLFNPDSVLRTDNDNH